MLKLMKWAFHLGQKFERQRIAGILAEGRRSVPYREGIVGQDSPEKENRQLAVQRVVNNIIDEITEERRDFTDGHSLLFPKGKND